MVSKVAIYVRVSTHYQVDKDSLQVQKRELIAYTQLVLGIQNYEIFEDAGFSAKNTERPEYQAMMQRIRNGEFSHILVWKIDRISRNLLDFSEMYGELKKYGVIFISKNEQFDTSSAIGEAMLKIILVFAELERKMTAERVTAVMLSRANVGKWNGGRVPYGYVHTENGFELNPAESPVAEKIFELYASDQSILSVVDYLNQKGYTTRQGKVWTPPSVHKILTNVFYVGDYRYNVHKDGRGVGRKDESEWIIVPDHHLPIVSRAKFEYVQKRLKKNQRGSVLKGKTYQRKNTHIFAGVLRCAICGESLSATADRRRANGWQPSVYACNGRRKRVCPSKFILDTALAPQVFQYLSNMIRLQGTFTSDMSISDAKKILMSGESFENLSDIVGVSETLQKLAKAEFSPLWQSSEDDQSVDINLLKSRLRKLKIALDRLKSLYLYSDSSMPESEYTIERTKIENEAQELEKQISELTANQLEEAPSSETFMTQASAYLLMDILVDYSDKRFIDFLMSADKQVCKSFVNACVSTIEISNGQMSSITFKNGVKHILEYKKSTSD